MTQAEDIGHVMEFSRWQDYSVCGRMYAEQPYMAKMFDKIFFGKPGRPTLQRNYAEYCDDCPVRQLCLEDAIVHDERTAIWGGLTYSQRRMLYSKRAELFEQAVRKGWIDSSRLESWDRAQVRVIQQQMQAEKTQVEEPPKETPILVLQRKPKVSLSIQTSDTQSQVG